MSWGICTGSCSQSDQNANAMLTEGGIKRMTLEDKPESQFICRMLCSPMATSKLLTPLAEVPAKEIPAALLWANSHLSPFLTYYAGLSLPPPRYLSNNQRGIGTPLFKGKSVLILYDKFSQSYL